MRLYITAAGVYAGTQVEAKRDGKGWHEEIVPTDKTGLIDYLNKLKYGDCVDMVEVQPVDAGLTTSEKIEAETAEIESNWERPTRVEPALAAPYGEPRMPSMPTDTGRFKLRVGNEADQIAEYILDEKTPAFAVSTILGAAMERVERLTRLLD